MLLNLSYAYKSPGRPGMGTRLYTSNKLQGDAKVPHHPPILTNKSPAPVLKYTTNTISKPPLETSILMSWQVSFPHYVHHNLMNIFLFIFSVHSAIFLFICFFYYLLPCNVSSMKIRNTPTYQSFLTLRTNSNKLEARAQNKLASDFREQRSWSLRQQRKLRRNLTWSAKFPRGSGTGRVSNFGSGSGHGKVSWKALRSIWGLPCWSSG